MKFLTSLAFMLSGAVIGATSALQYGTERVMDERVKLVECLVEQDTIMRVAIEGCKRKVKEACDECEL